MEKINCTNLARVVTKAGVILLESGAETSRVEDTMKRICLAYGADVVDAYVTPTVLIISFSRGEEMSHNIKRIENRNTNLNRVSLVNDLSRSLSTSIMPLELLNEKLDNIAKTTTYGYKELLFGSAICSFGFAFFFDGGLNDALVATFIGLITYAVVLSLDKVTMTSFFKYSLSGAILTLLAIVAAYYNLCDRDIVIIASIMLLVPGLAITNAIKDTVNGDLSSGLARAIEAIFIAIAIAVGSGLVFTLVRGLL